MKKKELDACVFLPKPIIVFLYAQKDVAKDVAASTETPSVDHDTLEAARKLCDEERKKTATFKRMKLPVSLFIRTLGDCFENQVPRKKEFHH